jgi:hypothetical protein
MGRPQRDLLNASAVPVVQLVYVLVAMYISRKLCLYIAREALIFLPLVTSGLCLH